VSKTNKRPAGTDAGPARIPVGHSSVLAEGPSPSRARTYVAVVAVETLVIAALWWFSQHFSA